MRANRLGKDCDGTVLTITKALGDSWFAVYARDALESSSELFGILDDAYQPRLRHRVRNTTHRAVSPTLSCESAR